MSGSEASEEELTAEESWKQGSGEGEKVFLVREKVSGGTNESAFVRACAKGHIKLPICVGTYIFDIIIRYCQEP